MPNYCLIVDAPLAEEYSGRLTNKFPHHRKVNDVVWVVRSGLVTREISEAIFPLGPEGKPSVRHILFRVDAWWGLYDPSLWEWLSLPEPPLDG